MFLHFKYDQRICNRGYLAPVQKKKPEKYVLSGTTATHW
jgi:hypothetical protein